MHKKSFEINDTSLFVSQTIIDKLLDQVDDAYSLSIPLIASGLLRDQKRFLACLSKIKIKLNKLDDDGFKAWLNGRILLAAKNIENREAIKEAKNHIEQYLSSHTNDKSAFCTWAMGYLAAYDQETYKAHIEQSFNLSTELTKKYHTIKSESNPNADKVQSDLSDATWAWVMNLQASALANDKKTYHEIINQIKTITSNSSLAGALTAALLRTKASNDYPAWALAIATFAAVAIRDEDNYHQLKAATLESLKIATQVKTEEFILGNLTLALAENNWNQFELQKLQTPFVI